MEKFNKLYEENKKTYNDELNRLKKNEYIKKVNKEINRINNLIKINSILKNTQEKNENNYYINDNINKAIECFQNSENKEIREISRDNIMLVKEDEIIINSNEENNKQNNNIFLSKKLKSEEEILPKIENYKKGMKNDNYINKNKYNNINNSIDLSDLYINLKEEGEILSNENDTISKKANKKYLEKDMNNGFDIVYNDIINDSYCPIEVNTVI